MNPISSKISCMFFLIILFCGSVITPNLTAEGDYHSDFKTNEFSVINQKILGIIDKINETLIRNFMEHLIFEIGCRYTGSYGCQKAANYIFNQFEEMGLKVQYHNWSARGNRWHPSLFISQNIEATHHGSEPDCEEAILFNAHYDTVKETVGANDDGSGTVGVLAAASVLSQYDFKRTLKFVTFSGEEVGLLGSHSYARSIYDQYTPLLVEFNADMIGKATTRENGRKMRLSQTEDAGWIADIMKNISKTYGLNFNITSGWNINRDASRGGSDYFDFIKLGYESLCVWQAEGDPYMHTPKDDISNINFSYLVNMTRHIAATMAVLADSEIEMPRIYIANPRHGKIYFNDNIRKNVEFYNPVVFDEINLYAEVNQGSYPIDRVEFYYNNKLIFTDTEKPYEYLLNKRSLWKHTIKVIVYDTKCNNATDQMDILFLNVLKN